ncbi:sugar kinase [Coriobacteriia bacterium Es71-Z0120]|uniref:NAD(P)H-hydrate dehydratase n=1 Tax=Parvivirga hydrogeniphila TaxID=2939460 RepID=UPI00226085A9|nr:NAD(P)H-hydrate dehydratase [Parvivirga hydrogeniphila]MCL4078042.1 sugar kinase [Parvivirga hydrogeniphila]
MTLLVVATYPVEGGPLVLGPAFLETDGSLRVGDAAVPHAQGTAAMLGAACAASRYLGTSAPWALIAGDIGRGDGTRAVFNALPAALAQARPSVVAFHYLQPIMALMREAVGAVEREAPGALLVADAGGMYAAKAAGLASRFELMTPDVGELGFLADPAATHPAYVSHYLFGTDGFDPVKLSGLAHERGGAARVLIVKGEIDHIAEQGEVVATVAEPLVPALEAIGGTGDTLAGLASAFLAAGFPTLDAAVCAARANREAGRVMGATPAMRARDLVAALPDVLRDNLCAWSGACAL